MKLFEDGPVELTSAVWRGSSGFRAKTFRRRIRRAVESRLMDESMNIIQATKYLRGSRAIGGVDVIEVTLLFQRRFRRHEGLPFPLHSTAPAKEVRRY